jgi:hypothetical protein
MYSVMRFGAASGNDPFGKVKGLIEDMIAQLEKEGSQDATHKAYCDKEMGETEQKHIEKTAEIDKLGSEIETMTARSAQAKQEASTTQADLADLMKAQAEATKIRQAEKAQFDENMPEMQNGLSGVKYALKVLREYYANDERAHDVAEGAASGVIGFLEVIESDMTRLLADMKATERTAQADYDTDTRTFDIEKAVKDRKVEHLTKTSAQLDKDISERKTDRDSVQTELSAILEYKAKLNEICIAKPETYEERSRRRDAEIAGLKEALSILDGEAVLLQRRSVGKDHRFLSRQGPMQPSQ